MKNLLTSDFIEENFDKEFSKSLKQHKINFYRKIINKLVQSYLQTPNITLFKSWFQNLILKYQNTHELLLYFLVHDKYIYTSDPQSQNLKSLMISMLNPIY